MNASRWFIVVVVAAVVGLVGGVAGGRLGHDLAEQEEYEFGTAFLAGSAAFPDAHGMATFEANVIKDEHVLKLQLEDAPELANTTLKVTIGITVGSFELNGKGDGTLTVKTKAGGLLPVVEEDALIEIKTVDGTLVASGSF